MDRIQGPTTPGCLEPLATSVDFKSWQARIQASPDVDDLMRVARAYLDSWQPHQLRFVPPELAVTAMPSCDALAARAVVSSHADLKCQGNEAERWLLRQMALTFGEAAARLRSLQGYRNYL